MSKMNDITRVVAHKTAALYASGNERQQAIFEALTLEKAIDRGESPVDAMALVDALRRMGVGLNEEERANAHSKDKTVEIKAVEESIVKNLTASGRTPEEINNMLGAMKCTGLIMAGGGITQGDNRGVTYAHTPNTAGKDDGLER